MIKFYREYWADENIPLPSYESKLAVGMDIRANLFGLDRENGIAIPPGEHVVVPTGLRTSFPAHLEMQCRPRSGLAAKHAVTVLNAPGTIDPDYRGELKVILINHGKQIYRVNHGDRIAQLVMVERISQSIEEVYNLDDLGYTERGEGGFGSTGVS